MPLVMKITRNVKMIIKKIKMIKIDKTMGRITCILQY